MPHSALTIRDLRQGSPSRGTPPRAGRVPGGAAADEAHAHPVSGTDRPEVRGLRHPAGRRALAVGLAACALVALVLAALLWESYAQSRMAAQDALADLARRQQIRNDDQFRAVEGLTARLAVILAPILQARSASGEAAEEAATSRRVGEAVRETVAGWPNVAAIHVSGSDGLQFHGSVGTLAPPRQIGESGWFRDLQALPQDGITILPPRYDQLRGAWLLPLGRRILRADGATLGYVVATLPLPLLTSALAESDLRRILSARLTRQDGRLLAAYPADPAALARAASGGADLDGNGNADRAETGAGAREAGGRYGTVLEVAAPADWVVQDWLRRMWPFLLAALAALMVMVGATVAAARQIGRRAAAMARMRAQNVLLAAQQDGALQGVAVADETGRLQYFNRQAEAIWRLQGQLAAGQRIEFMLECIAGMLTDPAELREMAREAARPTGGSLRTVLQLRDARRVECTVKALVDARGAVIGRIWSFLDISSELRAEEAIRWRSDYDPLTHLPNRFLFKRRLGEVMDAARCDGERGALLYIDLDGFKWINDTRGHAAGDQLLIQVADRLSTCVRSRDCLARLGGDEFIVMLPRTSGEAEARNMARRVLAAVAEPYRVDGHVCHLSASIGIVMFPSESDDVTSLLKKADMSMYAAKGEGKNRYCFFTPEMDAAVAERQRIELDLRAALGTDQFLFHYQPIIDLERGTLAGFEALLRWQHPTEGVLAPNRFVEVAEETGLITRISADAILQATRDLAPLFAVRPRLHLAVNLSVRQFQDQSLVELLAALRREGRIPLERFVFEITESLMMTGDANTREMFDLVRNSGAKIAVDDFGTGYSSLVYLQNFPVDYLKVDRSFVSNMIENDDSRQLVNSILSMAKSLRMAAIAEGVEDAAQVHHLQAHGCELAQGYYFSPPLDLQAALAFAENPEFMEVELPLPTPALAAQ